MIRLNISDLLVQKFSLIPENRAIIADFTSCAFIIDNLCCFTIVPIDNLEVTRVICKRFKIFHDALAMSGGAGANILFVVRLEDDGHDMSDPPRPQNGKLLPPTMSGQLRCKNDKKSVRVAPLIVNIPVYARNQLAENPPATTAHMSFCKVFMLLKTSFAFLLFAFSIMSTH